MSETRTVFDPFELKTVEVSNRLSDRLRGKYAIGPHLPNGKSEFGWRQFESPPIQHEAADEIDRLTARIEELEKALGWFLTDERFRVGVGGNPVAVERMIAEARSTLEASDRNGGQK